MNPMREIGIEKITLNMGAGTEKANMEKAMKLLKKITNAKPIQTQTTRRIPTWGIRPGLPIGCKVTLRGKKAEELLQRLLQAINNQLKESQFDKEGNFSFGIVEYLDIPGVEYDANIGITGLEVAVTLKRSGFRIKRRKKQKKKIPEKHKITKQESMEFIKNKFGIKFGA